MPDPANFRDTELQAIHGDRPQCPITLETQGLDKAHILGRGEDFGVKLDDPRRVLFSSPFNFTPLPRRTHVGPLHDHRYMRALLLEAADKKVRTAVLNGYYELTPIDHDFLDLARGWLATNRV